MVKPFRLLLFIGFLFVSLVVRPAFCDPVGSIPCKIIQHLPRLELESPAFEFILDTSGGLRARSWKNRFTGSQVSLGLGPEVELDFDTAEQRIWISGWKEDLPNRITHFFLPAEAQGKKLSLTLGGFGLYDYDRIDVSINGHEVGARQESGRWREPGTFDLSPSANAHQFLRFGEENILTIRCQNQFLRTKRMDDLQQDLRLSGPAEWPAQFEQYLTVGTPLTTPEVRVKRVRDLSRPTNGLAVVELESVDKSLGITVTYRWNDTEPVLHKFIEVQNLSPRARRLMNVRLGNYSTDKPVTEGEQGFPVYLETEFFAAIAHPSGWAIGQDRHLTLRQYPGRLLAPGERFASMEVVLGVAKSGGARQAFLDHVRSRSRRVLRGHDKPYAIYETFGGWIAEEYALTEKYILQMLDKVAEGKKQTGYEFDYCNTHFWVDNTGDLERFDPQRFPHGFTNIKARLDELRIKPGLWIDSSWRPWTIGKNPIVHSTYTHDEAYENGLYGLASFCRATDPIRTMYSTAFRHHIQENGIRLIKCDNLHAICYNPNHPHLPGVYSTEAIQSAVIQTCHDWDAANPDVLIMLYWGYRSPWWLLHGDTISEHGLAMEAATPGPLPTLYMRDGVTERMDEGHQWREDVPALCKDTLGIWLSDWAWNSHVGKERWQEGFVMDICRGSMLAQLWTDYSWLTPPERKQLADFIALLKAHPRCFTNPSLILGNPLKHEPYGYCCSNGQRAFVALNNCSWNDLSVPLEFNSKWRLPENGRWNIYRWHPRPARLTGERGDFEQVASILLRPFDVVLLEIVPEGTPPTLNRVFEPEPIPSKSSESSRPIELDVSGGPVEREPDTSAPWIILEPLSTASSGGATLTRRPDNSIRATGRGTTPDSYNITAKSGLTNFTAFRLEILPDPSLPGGGPGRGPNGNFVLNEFRVAVAPQTNPSQVTRIPLLRATADFARQTSGGWPISAAIDGDSGTGWQIDPEEGQAHEAVFQTEHPIPASGDSILIFALDQNTPEDHQIGRFRLAVTDASPAPAPRNSPRTHWIIRGQAPANSTGGTLVISAQVSLDDKPFSFASIQSRFVCTCVTSGQQLHCEPVLRGPGFPASWQAWRIPLEQSAAGRPFELQVTAKLPVDAQFTFKGHFVPAE